MVAGGESHGWDGFNATCNDRSVVITGECVSLPGEKTAVQKQTYTRWMNVFLKRCDPPLQVQDLFVDLGDGRALLALLEQLSGCQLVRQRGGEPPPAPTMTSDLDVGGGGYVRA
uniref:Calponin-homology (CH) domain-containing protein n=1 Tax=Gadus morhua TaxID=8049 RepID=A0A8C5CCV1_GADMO